MNKAVSLLNRVKSKISKTIRPVSGKYLAWQRILRDNRPQWQAAVKAARNGPPVLIATSSGSQAEAMPVESLMAIALTLRGANVHFLLCDRFLPACLTQSYSNRAGGAKFFKNGSSKFGCLTCLNAGYAVYRPLGLPIHLYSEFVTEQEYRSTDELSRSISAALIPGYKSDGAAVGEHALAGTLKFYARGDLEGEADAESVLRRYFKASLLTAHALRRLFNTFYYDCAVFHHGIYVPQGVIGEVARRLKRRVVNWVVTYRKNCFIFSHNDTYHHTLMFENTDKWENLRLTEDMRSQLIDYLKSRSQGARDWVWFFEKPQFDLKALSKELGVDFSKPCIGMLTNVIWDAQLHYPANIFPNMLEWVMQTIGYFSQRPDLQLIIRVHPAEITGTTPSRQLMAAEIRKKFPVLPKNIFIIPPDNQISTYAVIEQCNAAIVYGTKMGVELVSRGIPVVVAGEAWIRNKGLTLDARSISEYFEILDRLPLPGRLDESTIGRAHKYAYHFFFRRMIPLKMIEPVTDWPPYRLLFSSLDELLPGKAPGLDTICNGILNGSDFIHRAELYSLQQEKE